MIACASSGGTDVRGAQALPLPIHTFSGERGGSSQQRKRPNDPIKLPVKKVYVDSTITGFGIKNRNCWFNAFSNCTGVSGFENLSGMTCIDQVFTSCGSLETSNSFHLARDSAHHSGRNLT